MENMKMDVWQNDEEKEAMDKEKSCKKMNTERKKMTDMLYKVYREKNAGQSASNS